MKEWIYIIIGWNFGTFLLMGADKFLAVKNMRRISEQTLLTVAFVMGGFGSLLGSILFRHKTRKWKFRLLLPVALLFNLSVLFLIWYYLL
ncbi:DUF1294 domain-containing protein [Anoxybacterium hadale]|uniref:DUF1294 domain-containing protein n=1 Tax=Anoxybacterium hadale TaxID=3408580 RepID=A0ACD1AAB8_9FIRM|nr:DUF1294 domain-containing protein [Clostridiales bacterium]